MSDIGAYDAHRAGLGYSDREDPPVLCAAGLTDPDILALRAALRSILAETRRPNQGPSALWTLRGRLDAIAQTARNALDASGHAEPEEVHSGQ